MVPVRCVLLPRHLDFAAQFPEKVFIHQKKKSTQRNNRNAFTRHFTKKHPNVHPLQRLLSLRASDW